MRHRSKHELIRDILEAVKNNQAGITNIAFRAYLDYPTTLYYLSDLVAKGLLQNEHTGGKSSFRITPRGSEYITTFEKIAELIQLNGRIATRVGGISLVFLFFGLYTLLTGNTLSHMIPTMIHQTTQQAYQ